MLNLFPIQWLSLVAYMILRLSIGVLFIHYAKVHFGQRMQCTHQASIKILLFALYEFFIGLLFLFGAFTQIAALFAIAYGIGLAIIKSRISAVSLPPHPVLFLIFAISLSLFITGAGIAAVDLPV